MTDVGDILGFKPTKVNYTAAEEAQRILGDVDNNASTKLSGKLKKPKGMSREVFGLMGKDGIAPSVLTNKPITPSFKGKRLTISKGKWVWAPFVNSARGDGMKFSHWVKRDYQHSDYAYAKYNVITEPVVYSDEEYEKLLISDNWSRTDTDNLMYTCYKYDQRWPVISDRFDMIPTRRVEELQARFYFVLSILRAHRTGTLVNKSSSNSYDENSHTISNYVQSATLSLEKEKNRRILLDNVFRRTKVEELEEIKIRDDLKAIDAAIKKNKKAANRASISNASNSTQNSTNSSNNNQIESKKISSAIPLASTIQPSVEPFEGLIPGKPCLQSSRLIVEESSLGLSKILFKKMNAVLKELSPPTAPLPTKAVCDMYDNVHLDVITLLSLQNILLKKEKELQDIYQRNPNLSARDRIDIPFEVILGKTPSKTKNSYPSKVPDSSYFSNLNDNDRNSSDSMNKLSEDNNTIMTSVNVPVKKVINFYSFFNFEYFIINFY
jgi:hypothetical protein